MKLLISQVILWTACFLVGCGDAPKNYTVDVNGYICTACSTKFYTTGGNYAQQCPQCKKGSINEVATYICPKDQQKTIAPQSRAGARCQQCNATVEVSQYPAEEDLKAWGATEKSKAEVGAN